MKFRTVAFYVLSIAITAACIAGQFAVQKRAASLQAQNKAHRRHLSANVAQSPHRGGLPSVSPVGAEVLDPPQPKEPAEPSISAAGSSEDPPGKLRTPHDAAPIAPRDRRQEDGLESIIDEEVPGISLEERDIWREELKGLPEAMQRGILRFRRDSQPHTLAPPPLDPPKVAVKRREPIAPADPQELPQYESISPGFNDGSIQLSLSTIRLARDVVLNNIANANTTSFKRSRVHFGDLPYNHVIVPGHQDREGQRAPVGISVGLGVHAAGTIRDHSPGSLQKTGNNLDVAIAGDGFFQVQDGDEILYTRAGSLTLNADGQIVFASAERGRLLEPAVAVPGDATEIQISQDGFVSVRQPDDKTWTQVGQLQLARFVNPGGLEPRGENLYAETEASGTPVLGEPGTKGRGKLRPGYLEASNVNLLDELLVLRRLNQQYKALVSASALPDPEARPIETPVPRKPSHAANIAGPRRAAADRR